MMFDLAQQVEDMLYVYAGRKKEQRKGATTPVLLMLLFRCNAQRHLVATVRSLLHSTVFLSPILEQLFYPIKVPITW